MWTNITITCPHFSPFTVLIPSPTIIITPLSPFLTLALPFVLNLTPVKLSIIYSAFRKKKKKKTGTVMFSLKLRTAPLRDATPYC